MGAKSDQVAALRIAKAERLEQRIKTGVTIHKGVVLTPAMAVEVMIAAVNNVIAEAAVVNADAHVNADAQRSAKWRAAHPDTNRQRAREGMRKLRAAKKDTNV